VKSAFDIAKDVRSGATTAVAEAERSLTAIRARNEELNVFVHIDDEGALATAQRVDEQVARGEDPGALAGVPLALKDNLCHVGQLTTAGSRILEGWKSPYSATVVKLVVKAGAVPMGKTNMDEFAMGSSTETSYYGPTRNPLDPTRVPGGRTA
jgi:aspartyl-tRNA(Asn)/glutamyl-tRNA(Gln) amidotransferase subunit A